MQSLLHPCLCFMCHAMLGRLVDTHSHMHSSVPPRPSPILADSRQLGVTAHLTCSMSDLGVTAAASAHIRTWSRMWAHSSTAAMTRKMARPPRLDATASICGSAYDALLKATCVARQANSSRHAYHGR